ncbi:hypothetical protein [Nocardioides xinjiangensis]|uniref:hypothetical protein n=1 Tax=Nocardioides xinjiangensis TaxID=2817376 RepID=UPI001B313308|nr:hypothetical protein [Nocardioides sp. SYSU D00778]
MTLFEETHVAWPVELLARLGFHPRDAARLRAVLPSVDKSTVTYLHQRTETEPRSVFWNNPGTYVVWAIHNITITQAIRLTEAGRGVVDVLTILDAVRKHVHPRLSINGVDLAHAWVMERRVPRHRLARYIELGLPPATAAALEADPSSPPSDAALETLAALRRP